MAVLSIAAVAGGCGRGADALPVPGWSVDEEPFLVIGADRSRSGHRLDRVAGAARLDDGRVAIAEAATAELRFFADDGRLLSATGAATEGFIALFGRMPGDTLLVLLTDGNIQRFDPDGTPGQLRPFRLKPRDTCRAPSSCSLQFVPSGNLMRRSDLAGPDQVCGAPGSGVRRTRALFTTIDWTTGRVDSLGTFPGTEWNGGNRRAYGAELAIAASDRFFFVAETAGDSIIVLDSNGVRTAAWRVPLPARTIDRAARRRRNAPMTMLRNRSDPTADAWSYPARYPRLARLFTDRAGYLWVMRYPEAVDPLRTARYQCLIAPDVPAEGADWIVLAPDGTTASAVHTPPGLFPVDVGDDYVLGLASDSLGPSIRLHTLDRGATSIQPQPEII